MNRKNSRNSENPEIGREGMNELTKEMPASKSISNMTIAIIFSISILILFLLLNFRILIFNEEYYAYELRKFGTYENFPELSEQQVNKKIAEVISFMRGQEEFGEDTNDGFFDTAEISHLYDVRKRIKTANMLLFLFGIFAICLFPLIVLICRRSREKMKCTELCVDIVLKAFILFLLFASAIFLFSLSDFGFALLFVLFHKVLFREGNWLFPQDSSLIRMFPEQFFQHFAMHIFALSVLEITVLVVFLKFLSVKLLSKSRPAQ